jgi:sugar O-acyltransferase (sialic acid O-acetyltransferase NeuD family)
VVADILLCQHKSGLAVRPVGYVDDGPALRGRSFEGLPVFGPVADRDRASYDALILAVGDNRTRARLFGELQAEGESFVFAVHPRAVVASSARIGEGSVVCAGAVVNPGAVVGENVILNTACGVDHHNTIGNHAHLAPGVRLGGGVYVGEGVLVGVGASVLPGVSIGDWAVIGAGAAVVRDVPPGRTAAGVPARCLPTRKGRESGVPQIAIDSHPRNQGGSR